MSEYRVRKRMPEPSVPPDHPFEPLSPGDRFICRHEVARDKNDLPVFCNLARRYHPLEPAEPQGDGP